MTNFERIKAMTIEEMAKFLCDMMPSCESYCPAFDVCRTGMDDWLEMESGVQDEAD